MMFIQPYSLLYIFPTDSPGQIKHMILEFLKKNVFLKFFRFLEKYKKKNNK